MSGHSRTNGANALAQSWDDFEQESGVRRKNTWLPLDILDDRTYEATPQLRAAPAAARRSVPGPPDRGSPGAARIRIGLGRKGTPGHVRAQSAARGKLPAQSRAVAILVGGTFALLAAYAALSAAVEWTQTTVNDIQYGRPRTMQIDAYVGHGEAEGSPTHFVAMNLNRRVTILEMPGGDSSKASAIIGPYLFGSGEDLTPVKIATDDVNADGKADLVVTVKNEQLIYINDGSNFKLMSAEERRALHRALADGSSKRGQSPDSAPGTNK